MSCPMLWGSGVSTLCLGHGAGLWCINWSKTSHLKPEEKLLYFIPTKLRASFESSTISLEKKIKCQNRSSTVEYEFFLLLILLQRNCKDFVQLCQLYQKVSFSYVLFQARESTSLLTGTVQGETGSCRYLCQTTEKYEKSLTRAFRYSEILRAWQHHQFCIDSSSQTKVIWEVNWGEKKQSLIHCYTNPYACRGAGA